MEIWYSGLPIAQWWWWCGGRGGIDLCENGKEFAWSVWRLHQQDGASSPNV